MIYRRKPDPVDAERVDLKDAVQMERLGIWVRDDGIRIGAPMGSICLGLVNVEVHTDDWILTHPDGRRDVLSDEDFRKMYESVPEEKKPVVLVGCPCGALVEHPGTTLFTNQVVYCPFCKSRFLLRAEDEEDIEDLHRAFKKAEKP